MSFPKQRRGRMSEPLSLLRRERSLSRPGQRRMALACAAIALAAPPAGSAGAPQPDPATGPSSSGLQPDAFHDAAPRLQLPTTVRGSFPVPTSLRMPAVPVPTVARPRDLLPAALALLALVATSGCFLAVAARSRQEGLGA